jgi:hypothetical protein
MDNRTFRADERLNQLTDSDSAWGPLLFLRPERHELMTPTRVLLISAALGTFYGMLANVALSLLMRTGDQGKPSAFLIPIVFTIIQFVCAELSVVSAWNRRARQLSRRMSWEELTGRPLPPPRDDQQAAE